MSSSGVVREFTNAECNFHIDIVFSNIIPNGSSHALLLYLLRVNPTESTQLIDETITEREQRHLQNVQGGRFILYESYKHRVMFKKYLSKKRIPSREKVVFRQVGSSRNPA